MSEQYNLIWIRERTLLKTSYEDTRKYQMICVVAMANNRVIGDGDGLVWHLPGDLPRVKSITMGCPLIMGRRTWSSIGGHYLDGHQSF